MSDILMTSSQQMHYLLSRRQCRTVAAIMVVRTLEGLGSGIGISGFWSHISLKTLMPTNCGAEATNKRHMSVG